jgi:two-component system sensor histidine kinase KdpD
MEPRDPDRPDPDRLLERLRHDADKQRRGRVKIWLGAAPGVGKTFAMLTQAHRLRASGDDVVIGLRRDARTRRDATAHGRPRTACRGAPCSTAARR